MHMDEEWNVNGSYACNRRYHKLLMEEYLERWHIQSAVGDSVAINIYGEQDMKIFESGVKYFK